MLSGKEETTESPAAMTKATVEVIEMNFMVKEKVEKERLERVGGPECLGDCEVTAVCGERVRLGSSLSYLYTSHTTGQI